MVRRIIVPTKLLLLLSLTITGLCSSPSRARAAKPEKWLPLAKQISKPRLHPDEEEKTRVALYSLPKGDLVAALEYIVRNKKESAFWAGELLDHRPDNRTASIIGSRFESWTVSQKRYFLKEPLQRTLLTHPEVVGFKALVRDSLLRSVNSPHAKLDPYVLDLLATDVSLLAQNVDYEILRKVVDKNSNSLAAWCALVRDEKVTDAEVKKAYALWPRSSGNKKLVLAAVCMGSVAECKNYFWKEVERNSEILNSFNVDEWMKQDPKSGLKTFYKIQEALNSLSVLFYVRNREVETYCHSKLSSNGHYLQEMAFRVLGRNFYRGVVSVDKGNRKKFLQEVALSGLLYPQTKSDVRNYLKQVHQADLNAIIGARWTPIVFPLDYVDKLRNSI